MYNLGHTTSCHPIILDAISAIAIWLPSYIASATVALLFAVFGIHSLRMQDEEDGKEINDKGSHSIFFTTFLLLTIAKLGDKTQLTVVALNSASLPITIWIGATRALDFSFVLGILAGLFSSF